MVELFVLRFPPLRQRVERSKFVLSEGFKCLFVNGSGRGCQRVDGEGELVCMHVVILQRWIGQSPDARMGAEVGWCHQRNVMIVRR